MPYIRVAYKTEDRAFDCVSENHLEILIARDEISHFFRPSEKRWVNPRLDPIRAENENSYRGRERRTRGRSILPADLERERPAIGGKSNSASWLDGFWRKIEES
jgi:hypothetical protein